MRRESRIVATLGALLTLVALAPQAGAETAWIEPALDATLIEHPGGLRASGVGPHIFAGNNGQDTRRRAVLAFDLHEKIPRDATLVSVKLVLRMSQTAGGPARVALHRLSASWGEGASASGGGIGAPSQPGDATWLHTFYPDGFWAAPGGDFVASSASLVVDQPGVYEFGPSPEMIEDVRDWLGRPALNYGWLLRGDESGPGTAKRFGSRENPDPDARPLLVVEFVRDADDESDDENDDE